MQKLRALSRRTLIIIISSSVLLLGTITYFVFLNPKSENKIDDYTGWKVYTSEYTGFKFKYPDTWSVQDISSTDKETVTELDPDADKINIIDNTGNKIAVFSSYDIFSNISECDKNTKVGELSTIPDTNFEGEYLYGCSDITILSSTEIPKISNLYYVEGIITSDGETYTPICGITNENTTSLKASYYSPWFIGEKSKNTSNSKLVQFACKTDENDTNLTGLYNVFDTKEVASSEFEKDYFQNIRKIMLSLEYI